MCTHNIYFHDINMKMFTKVSLSICFLALSEEFPMDSKIKKKSSNQPR